MGLYKQKGKDIYSSNTILLLERTHSEEPKMVTKKVYVQVGRKMYPLEESKAVDVTADNLSRFLDENDVRLLREKEAY